jgi:hypothetical protein
LITILLITCLSLLVMKTLLSGPNELFRPIQNNFFRETISIVAAIIL